MKKFCKTIVFILLLIAAPGFKAQKLLSLMNEAWDSQWNKSALLTYSYNASQQVTCATTQRWDPISMTWTNSVKSTYTININGDPITNLQDIWIKSLNTWSPSAKVETTYTLVNKKSEETAAIWTGIAWENTMRQTHKYDGSGMLVESKYDNWNQSNLSWTDVTLVTYTNNANGDKTQQLIKQWDNTGQIWVNNSLLTMTYTAANKLLTVLNKKWANNNVWQNLFVSDYTYNSNNQLISTVGRSWSVQNSTFTNNSKTEFTYISSGKPDQATQIYWDNSTSTWLQWIRSTYNYEGGPIGIEELNEGHGFVYPNPSNSLITIIDPGTAGELYLTDLSGRILKKIQSETGHTTIDISELPRGVYLLTGSRKPVRVIKE
jgi:hypothetical protein